MTANRKKTYIFLLLTVLLGLLILSPIDQRNPMEQHTGSEECFGLLCSPIEHLVHHTYDIPKKSTYQNFSDFTMTFVPTAISKYISPSILPDPPPPKRTLS